MHLHPVSTQCKTRVNIACNGVKTQEESQKRRAPAYDTQQEDVRELRLATLYARVRSGTYQLHYHTIAERILQETRQFYLECQEQKLEK